MITEIEFKHNDPLFQNFADGLTGVIAKHTGQKAIFQGKVTDSGDCTEKGNYIYGTHRIKFTNEMQSVLRVSIVGDGTYEFEQEKTQELYKDVSDYCKSYMKQEEIVSYLSIDLRFFSKEGIENEFYYGGWRFIGFGGNEFVYPMTEELAELQKLAIYMNEHFPIGDGGLSVQTGTNKFRKIYTIDVTNENGVAKIGVFHDGLICAVKTKEEIDELAKLKKVKIKELEKVKQDAINTLKKIDPTFKYDGENGVVLLGTKMTINVEYDVFKKDYLMVFLKSKIKVKTLRQLEDKVAQFIIKKTT